MSSNEKFLDPGSHFCLLTKIGSAFQALTQALPRACLFPTYLKKPRLRFFSVEIEESRSLQDQYPRLARLLVKTLQSRLNRASSPVS